MSKQEQIDGLRKRVQDLELDSTLYIGPREIKIKDCLGMIIEYLNIKYVPKECTNHKFIKGDSNE